MKNDSYYGARTGNSITVKFPFAVRQVSATEVEVELGEGFQFPTAILKFPEDFRGDTRRVTEAANRAMVQTFVPEVVTVGVPE